MKLLTPIFAFIACILLAGCEDQEYNETGAVPPGETDEFAADAAGDTDAVIILDETEGEPGMADDETYQAAKPAVDEPTDQAAATNDQAAAQQGDDAGEQAKNDANAESTQPTPDAETASDQADGQPGSETPDSDEADVVDEVE